MKLQNLTFLYIFAGIITTAFFEMKWIRRTIFVFIIFINATVGFSQTSKKQQREEIDNLINLSKKSTFDVSIDSTLQFALQAFSKSQSINYKKGEVSACNLIGQAMFNSGNYKEALDYFAKADAVKSNENLSLFFSQIYKTRILIYYELGMMDRAIKSLHHALSTSKEIADENSRKFINSQIYEILADIYSSQNNQDSLDYYINQNLRLIADIDEKIAYPAKINLYTFIAAQKLKTKDFESSKKYLFDATELLNKYDYAYKSNTLKALGDVYLASDSIDKALEYYRKAETNIEETKINAELPELYKSFVLAFQKTEKQDSVRFYQEKNNHRT